MAGCVPTDSRRFLKSVEGRVLVVEGVLQFLGTPFIGNRDRVLCVIPEHCSAVTPARSEAVDRSHGASSLVMLMLTSR